MPAPPSPPSQTGPLFRQSQPFRRRAGRRDNDPRFVARFPDPDFERALRQVYIRHYVLDDFGSEAQRLLPHNMHQFRPLNPMLEARIIFHFGRNHELPARAEHLLPFAHAAVNHQRLQIGAARIKGGCVARRPGTDYNQFVNHRTLLILDFGFWILDWSRVRNPLVYDTLYAGRMARILGCRENPQSKIQKYQTPHEA